MSYRPTVRPSIADRALPVKGFGLPPRLKARGYGKRSRLKPAAAYRTPDVRHMRSDRTVQPRSRGFVLSVARCFSAGRRHGKQTAPSLNVAAAISGEGQGDEAGPDLSPPQPFSPLRGERRERGDPFPHREGGLGMTPPATEVAACRLRSPPARAGAARRESAKAGYEVTGRGSTTNHAPYPNAGRLARMA